MKAQDWAKADAKLARAQDRLEKVLEETRSEHPTYAESVQAIITLVGDLRSKGQIIAMVEQDPS